jgi:hypothetical protein
VTTTFTSHWLQDTITGEGAQSPATTRVIQITVQPCGVHGEARWLRNEALLGDARFKTVEELIFPEEGGAATVVQRFLAFREEQRQHPTAREICALHTRLHLFPSDLVPHRTKTEDECHMDRAALQAERGDENAALASLNACPGSADTWFWRTQARRAHINRALGGESPDTERDWQLAVAHARFVTDAAQRQNIDRLEPYWFGDSYRSAEDMVGVASETLTNYYLSVAKDPQAALQASEIAEAVYRMSSDLQELRVDALRQLGRVEEAYAIHKTWRLGVPEIEESSGYQAYVKALDSAERETQAQRVRALQFEWEDGAPASEGDLALLRQRFPHLPAAYVQWITRASRHTLRVMDGDREEIYPLLSVEQALEAHDDFMHWLHLHDENAPDLAREIADLIRESGVDPLGMLPLVGVSKTPDCFLLRTTGPDAGAVYLWSHEEPGTFSHIVESAGQLFPWLIEQAKAGHTFVL